MRTRIPAHALALCLLAAPLAAQPLPDALQAASPDMAGLPPAPVALPAPLPSPTPPADLNAARQRWQQSNRDVGQFPRGHADLLRWEADRSRGTPGANPPAAAPLTEPEALRQSLRDRPDLVLPPGANAQESAAHRQALVQHTLALRRAWLDAVAAREALDHQRARLLATDTAAELGQRMVQAGNWSTARLLREQLAQAQQQTAVLQAQTDEARATEALLRAMGVWRPDEVQAIGHRLPRSLPALPPLPAAPADVEGPVLRARPELDNRRVEAGREARSLSDASRRQWQAALDAAVRALPADGLPTQALRLDDPRPQRETGLQATLTEEAALRQDAVRLRSQAREAWRDLQHRHALATQAQQVLLPLQAALEQETLLRYNGMLQSTWDLLEAGRARIDAAAQASAMRHAFWQAQLNWQGLLAGADPHPTADAARATAPAGNAAAH